MRVSIIERRTIGSSQREMRNPCWCGVTDVKKAKYAPNRVICSRLALPFSMALTSGASYWRKVSSMASTWPISWSSFHGRVIEGSQVNHWLRQHGDYQPILA